MIWGRGSECLHTLLSAYRDTGVGHLEIAEARLGRASQYLLDEGVH